MQILIMFLALFTSCGNANTSDTNNNITATEDPVEEVVLQDKEDELEDEEDLQEMIVGKFTKEDLQEGSYATWFNAGYENYNPGDEEIETIKNNISQYEIVGFIGTWCPDSRREIPKFFKILDEAGYDLSKVTMVGVNRGKSTPENLEEGYDMKRVPTFIFLKDGKEVNRYVEYAGESIEADIAKIVSGEDYKNSYYN